MAPEAVMLLVDSSEYMRNGDFTPTRFEAQMDAISVIFNSKINSNPENTVGVMTMGGAGGKGPEVLATPTNDLGKILSALHKATIGGESDLHTGIQVAQLALKHRQNKTQRQRIILLLGSPLSESASEKELVKLGKKLKKNNVAVDVVTFVGDSEADEAVDGENNGGVEAVLGRFVDSVQSGENSHIISVPAGPHLLSDIIASSSILRGEDGYSGGDGGVGESSGGAGGSNFEFGVDPDMDPELAMVLRMSMEEEQARQARANGEESSSSAPLATVSETPSNAAATAEVPSEPTASTPVETVSASKLQAQDTENEDNEEDAELKAALALSSGADGDVEMGDGDEGEDEEDEDEEEAIRKAIELSMQEDQKK